MESSGVQPKKYAILWSPHGVHENSMGPSKVLLFLENAVEEGHVGGFMII
jgi:hypothetical protein